MADFIPKANGDFINWLANLKTKIATQGPALGLTAAQILAIQNLCDQLTTAVQAVEQKRADWLAASNNKQTVSGTAIPTLRAAIGLWKKNAAMTPAIAAELQINGTGTAFDPDSFKASLTADVFPGFVRFKFVKSETDGIILNRRLKGQTAWNFVSRDTNSPYEDHTPVATPGTAEQREYQAQAVLNDQPIGQPSDIVSVTVAG